MSSHKPEPGREAYKLAKDLAEKTILPTSWRSRGYLPHYDNTDLLQAITFRLGDSIPKEKLTRLQEDTNQLPTDKRSRAIRKNLGTWLDQGYGCCALQHPDVASTLTESLTRFDGERYELLSWVIMPNHVHVLIQPHLELSKIVQSWKSYVGGWTLERWDQLGFPAPRPNRLWMPDYWDRYIRNEEHLRLALAYIRENPNKAGLTNWPWMGEREPERGAPAPPEQSDPPNEKRSTSTD